MADASERDSARRRENAHGRRAGALAALAMCMLSFLLGRAISQPISAMTAALTRLAVGDFNVALPGQSRRDEIGEMAGAARIFKDNMIETERLRAEQLADQQAQSIQRRDERLRLASGFQDAVGSIVDKVSSEATETRGRGLDPDADRRGHARNCRAWCRAHRVKPPAIFNRWPRLPAR